MGKQDMGTVQRVHSSLCGSDAVLTSKVPVNDDDEMTHESPTRVIQENVTEWDQTKVRRRTVGASKVGSRR